MRNILGFSSRNIFPHTCQFVQNINWEKLHYTMRLKTGNNTMLQKMAKGVRWKKSPPHLRITLKKDLLENFWLCDVPPMIILGSYLLPALPTLCRFFFFCECRYKFSPCDSGGLEPNNYLWLSFLAQAHQGEINFGNNHGFWERLNRSCPEWHQVMGIPIFLAHLLVSLIAIVLYNYILRPRRLHILMDHIH